MPVSSLAETATFTMDEQRSHVGHPIKIGGLSLMEYAETIQMMPTLFIGSDVLGFVLYNYFKLHHGELKVF